jgi:drug/metabolite transporter (DMT)-like permease
MFRSATDTPSGQPLLYSPVANADTDRERERETQRGRSTYNTPTGRLSPGLVSASSDLHARPLTPRLITPTTSQPPPTSRPPLFTRRSTLRSRSPATNARLAARRKYTYASFFLVVSLVSFTIQTELAAHVSTELGWDKAYCMLYLTHGSWAFLWPVQLLILRIQKWDVPWPTFWRQHVWLLRTTAQMTQLRTLDPPRHHHHGSKTGPWGYLARTTALVTTALTIAGLSWYVAVNKTTPSDLTAIYNCSAFFAYAFSVPLLRERVRWDKSCAVGVAVAGVLVVAYGDTAKGSTSASAGSVGEDKTSTRFAGNLIIGAGSVLYGLYEVLYKRLACPPDGVSPGRGMIFANFFGSLIGLFTLTVLWIPLPILHILNIETFALPTGRTALLLFISIIMNATFAGSFLVLISLTSPVLSSVAALLTIFIVAVVDWFKTGEPLSPAALFGGMLIVAAFGVLSVSTWREMSEDERKREAGEDGSSSDSGNGSEDEEERED